MNLPADVDDVRTRLFREELGDVELRFRLIDRGAEGMVGTEMRCRICNPCTGGIAMDCDDGLAMLKF